MRNGSACIHRPHKEYEAGIERDKRVFRNIIVLTTVDGSEQIVPYL